MADNSLKKGRFTKYSNKIGLFSNSSHGFISQSPNVVLSFPYKDAVLEGAMSKEDVGRDERFLHYEIDKADIDTLEDPKVLTDFKLIDKNGESQLGANSDIEFFDENSKLKQNLLIKGNNLLALYTLREKLAGKVKLIYIDPPYNTGGDGFKYNDKFKHSAWLAFMKNRLEVARELLTDDGVVFVHCDNTEQAYLKVLMDEIFGNDQFIETISVVNNPRGRDYGGVANMHEFIHVYAKSQLDYKMYQITDLEKEFPYTDAISPYELRELRNRNTAFNDKNRPNLCYPFYVNTANDIGEGLLEISLEPKAGYVEVLPAKSQGIQTVWRWGKTKAQENLNVHIAAKAMKEDGRFMIVEKYRKNTRLARSVWWDKDVNSEKGTVHLRELFGSRVFGFPKPETLMKRVLEIGTKENDIVLDFCLGSGTTATTAHKMNRRWVGIEQMDYIEEVAKERLKKVVAGEQGGISKAVSWQGGGSFIYLELKKYNQEFVDKINEAGNMGKLDEVYSDMAKNAFLKFWFDKKEFEKDENFRNLSLEERKQKLIDVLDENQLYLNYADMDDKKYHVTETEKVLTDKFYGANQ